MGELRVIGVEGLPEVTEGMKIGELIAARAELRDGDIVVISQKIVSKAEGMVRCLAEVEPSARAIELGNRLGKEPALIELILSESREILREDRVLITETHHGFVCANAGIDTSNLPRDGTACLLPTNPDASARAIRGEIGATTVGQFQRALKSGPHGGQNSAPAEFVPAAVVIADSFGRAWRVGQAEVAIGCAGLAPLDDWRGRDDAHGRELTATAIALADQVAAAADLVRVKDSGVPAAILRGLGRHVTAEDGPGAAALRRSPAEDLFR
ncbi:MAG TPA: coenzyme F420-0:L-glutamate ligase [Solirubrobacterales bacterium]|nr:coenzyme F420-0:L-glutamate ligase [Solirubrobacterales bacterium]